MASGVFLEGDHWYGLLPRSSVGVALLLNQKVQLNLGTKYWGSACLLLMQNIPKGCLVCSLVFHV